MYDTQTNILRGQTKSDSYFLWQGHLALGVNNTVWSGPHGQAQSMFGAGDRIVLPSWHFPSARTDVPMTRWLKGGELENYF